MKFQFQIIALARNSSAGTSGSTTNLGKYDGRHGEIFTITSRSAWGVPSGAVLRCAFVLQPPCSLDFGCGSASDTPSARSRVMSRPPTFRTDFRAGEEAILHGPLSTLQLNTAWTCSGSKRPDLICRRYSVLHHIPDYLRPSPSWPAFAGPGRHLPRS